MAGGNTNNSPLVLSDDEDMESRSTERDEVNVDEVDVDNALRPSMYAHSHPECRFKVNPYLEGKAHLIAMCTELSTSYAGLRDCALGTLLGASAILMAPWEGLEGTQRSISTCKETVLSCVHEVFTRVLQLKCAGEVLKKLEEDPTYRPEGDMKKCVDELFIDDMN